MIQESPQNKFLADAAHEFQTPLAILRMNLESLPRGRTARSRRTRQIMEMTLDRLNRLVNGLLLAARLNHAEDFLSRKEFNLQTLIQETCEDCSVLAENKGITLIYNRNVPRSDGSDPLQISGDRDRLKEVLLNLLSNAFKHTPPGGTISMETEVENSIVAVSIADTGSGIAKENLPKIFERFYRIHDGTAPGLGIGLHLSKQIIEAHGGTITAESRFGQGARFTVHLPILSVSDGEINGQSGRPRQAEAVLQ